MVSLHCGCTVHRPRNFASTVNLTSFCGYRALKKASSIAIAHPNCLSPHMFNEMHATFTGHLTQCKETSQICRSFNLLDYSSLLPHP